MSAEEQAPFHALVKLIEQELELAGQGRVDELQEAVARTGEFMATLPNPAPASARQLVLRAEALRGRVAIEVTRLRDGLSASRSALRRNRDIARSYGPPSAGRISTTA